MDIRRNVQTTGKQVRALGQGLASKRHVWLRAVESKKPGVKLEIHMVTHKGLGDQDDDISGEQGKAG